MHEVAVPVAPPPQPQQLQPTTPTNNYWFLNQPSQQTASVPQDTVTFNTQVVAPGASAASLPVAAATPTADEESFIKQHRNQPAFSPNMHGHLHVIQPLSAQKATPVPMPAPTTPIPAPQGVTVQAGQSDDDATGNNNKTMSKQPSQQVTRTPDTAILDLATG